MSQQASLFTTTHDRATGRVVNHPARHTDPDSSHLAAKRLRESGKLGQRCLEAMRALVDWNISRVNFSSMRPDTIDDPTAMELAYGDDGSRHELAKRLADCRKKKLVENPSARPCAITGNVAQTWRLTPAGRERLRREGV